MIKLTINQIAQINDFLVAQYNLKYDEVREEVLDHIACEIEEKMGIDVSFEEALKITLSKWDSPLKSSTMGVYSGIPNFIAKRMMYADFKVQIIGVALICLGLFIVNELNWFSAHQMSKLSLLLFTVSIFSTSIVVHYLKSQDSFRMKFYKMQFGGVYLCSLIGFTAALFNVNYKGYMVPHVVLCFIALIVTMFTIDFICKLLQENRRLKMN